MVLDLQFIQVLEDTLQGHEYHAHEGDLVGVAEQERGLWEQDLQDLFVLLGILFVDNIEPGLFALVPLPLLLLLFLLPSHKRVQQLVNILHGLQ